MRRRDFISLLGGVSVAWPIVGPSTARAQQAAMPVIGMLHSQTRESEAGRLAAFQQGLSETDFVVGRNVTVEHRYADGHNVRLPALAAELVERRVNVIFANTTPPAIAAKAATSAIPIVFVTGVDPVEVGLVASVNRPGANVTGVTFLSNQLIAKRMELLCDLVPVDSAIGMLAAEHNPNTATDVRDAQAAANTLRKMLYVEKISPQGDVDAAIAALLQRRIGALFVAPQADSRLWSSALIRLATEHKLPTSFGSSDHVTVGGLMSYGPDQADSYREAGAYTGRVLKGEKPATLPVMIATKFEFAVNLKTAKAIGVTIPPALLVLATTVIE
jgi:putative ABC transport system substrate-binding protein